MWRESDSILCIQMLSWDKVEMLTPTLNPNFYSVIIVNKIIFKIISNFLLSGQIISFFFFKKGVIQIKYVFWLLPLHLQHLHFKTLLSGETYVRHILMLAQIKNILRLIILLKCLFCVVSPKKKNNNLNTDPIFTYLINILFGFVLFSQIFLD